MRHSLCMTFVVFCHFVMMACLHMLRLVFFYLLSISLFLFLLNYDVCDVLGNKCAWFQRAS